MLQGKFKISMLYQKLPPMYSVLLITKNSPNVLSTLDNKKKRVG